MSIRPPSAAPPNLRGPAPLLPAGPSGWCWPGHGAGGRVGSAGIGRGRGARGWERPFQRGLEGLGKGAGGGGRLERRKPAGTRKFGPWPATRVTARLIGGAALTSARRRGQRGQGSASAAAAVEAAAAAALPLRGRTTVIGGRNAGPGPAGFVSKWGTEGHRDVGGYRRGECVRTRLTESERKREEGRNRDGGKGP